MTTVILTSSLSIAKSLYKILFVFISLYLAIFLLYLTQLLATKYYLAAVSIPENTDLEK